LTFLFSFLSSISLPSCTRFFSLSTFSFASRPALSFIDSAIFSFSFAACSFFSSSVSGLIASVLSSKFSCPLFEAWNIIMCSLRMSLPQSLHLKLFAAAATLAATLG
ncbi:hypothetical protein PMAYCL1PPCAC_00886, partial [Pristionchus mayeri]